MNDGVTLNYCFLDTQVEAVRERELPVVINEGGYEARRQSRMVQIDANDRGKAALEEESEFESSDSDEDVKTHYECIGRNAARVLERQGKLTHI